MRTKTQEPRTVVRAATRTLQVIIVHGEAQYRRSLVNMATRDGLQAIEIGGAGELIDYVIDSIRTNPHRLLADALIVDAEMGGMSIVGLVLALRSCEPDMPVVVLTEFADFVFAVTRSVGGVTVLSRREEPQRVRAALNALVAARV